MTASSSPAENYHPWTTYIAAREEARQHGDHKVGTDHLLLGLLRDHEMESILGTTLDLALAATMSRDKAALAAIGFTADVEAPLLRRRPLPLRPTIKAVLKDRLPLTPAAKAVLTDAGRPMRRGRHITAGDVLARLVQNVPPDPAASLLAGLDVDVHAVKLRISEPRAE
jgi:hypothetical protein